MSNDIWFLCVHPPLFLYFCLFVLALASGCVQDFFFFQGLLWQILTSLVFVVRMHIAVELLVTLGLTLYYILESIVLVFVPFSFRRKEVKGQRVLITGAGSGIGRLLSHQFAKLGCTLVLVDVNKAANEETAQSLKDYGVSAHAYCCDLSRREDVYKVLDKVKTDVGDIDILINNAGIVSGKKILECPDGLMQKTMDVNASAHFWTTKALLPGMLERKRGHVVTIASLAGTIGISGLVDYCASKFAAVGFDESLRMELATLGNTGVHTTVVCPYYINTGMFEGAKARFPILMPFLEPAHVVDRIMDGVLCNLEMVIIPRNMIVFIILKTVLPVKAFLLLCKFLGVSESMDDFIGRQKQE